VEKVFSRAANQSLQPTTAAFDGLREFTVAQRGRRD
jgi:hypothetical protein